MFGSVAKLEIMHANVSSVRKTNRASDTRHRRAQDETEKGALLKMAASWSVLATAAAEAAVLISLRVIVVRAVCMQTEERKRCKCCVWMYCEMQTASEESVRQDKLLKYINQDARSVPFRDASFERACLHIFCFVFVFVFVFVLLFVD